MVRSESEERDGGEEVADAGTDAGEGGKEEVGTTDSAAGGGGDEDVRKEGISSEFWLFSLLLLMSRFLVVVFFLLLGIRDWIPDFAPGSSPFLLMIISQMASTSCLLQSK